MNTIRIGRISFGDELDGDGELEVSIGDETYYLSQAEVEDLLEHLTKLSKIDKRHS